MRKCVFYILLLPGFLCFWACGGGGRTRAEKELHSAEASLAVLHTAGGLAVSLFASAPLISTPSNIDIAVRGRVGVVRKSTRLNSSPECGSCLPSRARIKTS